MRLTIGDNSQEDQMRMKAALGIKDASFLNANLPQNGNTTVQRINVNRT